MTYCWSYSVVLLEVMECDLGVNCSSGFSRIKVCRSVSGLVAFSAWLGLYRKAVLSRGRVVPVCLFDWFACLFLTLTFKAKLWFHFS